MYLTTTSASVGKFDNSKSQTGCRKDLVPCYEWEYLSRSTAEGNITELN